VRGLYPFYSELAARFAQAGHHAVTIDYFGRTAGLGPRDEEFDYRPHVSQTTVEQVQADVKAAIVELEERTEVTGVVAVGFCFGGMQAFLAATSPSLGLDAVIGFYAGLDTAERYGFPGPLQRADEIRGPLLGLFGGADQGIPVEQVRVFERKLSDAHVEHEIEIYAGAPHSFFDRSYAEHADACEDAWRRVLGFLGHVGTSPTR